MKRLLPLLMLLWCAALSAQTTFQEQTARLMNINAFLQDLRPATAPSPVTSSRLELAFELYPQPDLDTRIGRKDEPVDPPEVVPRLRLRYLWQSGLFAGGTVVPGIEYEGYDADTYAVELGYRFRASNWGLQLRTSYGDGDILGPITETDAEDDFTYTNTGADIAASRSLSENLHIYGFGGWISADTDLLVASDGAFLEHEESTYYGGLGLTYDWQRLSFTFEQNFTDDYLASLILSATYRFQGGSR